MPGPMGAVVPKDQTAAERVRLFDLHAEGLQEVDSEATTGNQPVDDDNAPRPPSCRRDQVSGPLSELN